MEARFAEGEELVAKGELERAGAVFAQLLSEWPSNRVFTAQLLEVAHSLLSSASKWDKALEFSRNVLALDSHCTAAREMAEEAERRRKDVERLNVLGSRLLSCGTAENAVHTFLEEAVAVFEAAGAAFHDFTTSTPHHAGPEGNKIRLEDLHRARDGNSYMSDAGDCIVPVRLADTLLGAVALRSALLSLETAEAAVSLLVVSLDRLRAIERAAEAERLRFLRWPEEESRAAGKIPEGFQALVEELEAAVDPSVTICSAADFHYVDDPVCEECRGYPACALRAIREAAEEG